MPFRYETNPMHFAPVSRILWLTVFGSLVILLLWMYNQITRWNPWGSDNDPK